jgi:chemotaxis protein MotB
VRLLIDEGIAPTRLEAVGFADTRPLAKNDTPDGRAENRRVTILVRTGKPSGGP